MTDIRPDVRHDHGIMREIYDVSSEYAEVTNRLRQVGTREDVISEDFYSSALKLYASAVLDPETLARMTDGDRRDALIVLATVSLRWARKIRVGKVPGEFNPIPMNGEVRDDAKHD